MVIEWMMAGWRVAVERLMKDWSMAGQWPMDARGVQAEVPARGVRALRSRHLVASGGLDGISRVPR